MLVKFYTSPLISGLLTADVINNLLIVDLKIFCMQCAELQMRFSSSVGLRIFNMNTFIWSFFAVLIILFYFNESVIDIYSNFGVYVPFLNITTYLDLTRHVLIPRFIFRENHEKLFTAEELKQYDGENNSRLYIAILGQVFDVTTGASYYSVGQVYHGFTGRDASRAFVSGDFTEAGLIDDVLDLPLQDLIHLEEWLKVYQSKYEYKGKLIGRYYDTSGDTTAYHEELKTKLKQAEAEKDTKDKEKQKFPPCNIEWTSVKGSRVWCSMRSGGIERSWIGVPRKLYTPGSTSYRCACVNMSMKNDSPRDEVNISNFLTEYDDCDPNSYSCYVKT